MKICIRDTDCTEVWDGVFYKKLSNYPDISDWEMRTILEFTAYEAAYGRDCSIVCEDPALLRRILSGLAHPETYQNAPRPSLLTECTACPVRKGCETAFVCHVTSPESALSILRCGRILSAVNARRIPAWELAKETRNAARDPEDYFDYVMFTWGNCQAGDRLVTERRLGRSPDTQDLSDGFIPGIRFYFSYDRLVQHPRRVFDGVLPFKLRDEVELEPWVHTIVIPSMHKDLLAPYVPLSLADRVLYMEQDQQDIWAWAEKVYALVEKRQ